MILFALILILIFFVIGYKTLSKIENSLNGMVHKEDFTNNVNELNIKNECKDIDDKYNELLSTPVAVNIPKPEYETKFYIGENKYKNNPVKPESNSFPINQFKYDGVFNAKKITNNKDYQIVKWDNDTTLDKNLHYDINRLINVPEKNIGIGYEIINLYKWNNINNYNDKLININTQKDTNCDGVYSPYNDVFVV